MLDIDLTGAMEAVGGDKALLKALVDDFIAEYPGIIANLHEMIRERNTDQVERSAHSLKGSVGVLGAKGAYNLAYQLECMGREGRLDRVEQVLQNLKAELGHVEAFFHAQDWSAVA